MRNVMSKRFICPCCGYPTLNEKASYEICILCNWEDDGQNDSNKDVVRGGPNADYSLTEARENFKKYLVMYSPGKDMRASGGDTEEERELKKQLINVYECISKEKNTMELDKLYAFAYKLEDKLDKVTSEKIEQYIHTN